MSSDDIDWNDPVWTWDAFYTCSCKCGCNIMVPPDGPSYCPFCLNNPQKHKPPPGQPERQILPEEFLMSSPSLIVEGFKPADSRWKKMKAIWDACRSASVDPPEEVNSFFNGEQPDDEGVKIDLAADYGSGDHESCTKYQRDGYAGFDINISKLPKDVKIIRVMISY